MSAIPLHSHYLSPIEYQAKEHPNKKRGGGFYAQCLVDEQKFDNSKNLKIRFLD
jgi:hypothetical protein